jgi:hypothetical protein
VIAGDVAAEQLATFFSQRNWDFHGILMGFYGGLMGF